MKLPFFKGKDLKDITLLDLTRAGFQSIGVGTLEGDILARANIRVLYNPMYDKVIRAYRIDETKVTKMSNSQLEEALHYLEHHQANTGSE